MTALQTPLPGVDLAPPPGSAPALAVVRTPELDRPGPPLPLAARAPEYDWPASPALELWALKVRLDALCRKGERREGWVSCRLIRRAMG